MLISCLAQQTMRPDVGPLAVASLAPATHNARSISRGYLEPKYLSLGPGVILSLRIDLVHVRFNIVANLVQRASSICTTRQQTTIMLSSVKPQI